jgi:hypothetical protein
MTDQHGTVIPNSIDVKGRTQVTYTEGIRPDAKRAHRAHTLIVTPLGTIAQMVTKTEA